jgi:glycosyltransferase involved in cell wall biosynthesis
MKILFLAPLTRKIAPQITASRPRLIFDLINGLKKRGHKITVIGTADSKIPGVKIIPAIKKGFYEIEKSFENPFYAHISFLIKQALITEKISHGFDIIHNHCYPESIPLLLSKNFSCPTITTLHHSISLELDEALSMLKNVNIVCTAKSLKKNAKKTKILKIIPHGVDTNLYKFCKEKEDYLLWVGRLSKSKDKYGNFLDPKGIKLAIKLAKGTGYKLKLVANVEDVDFFNKEVKPELSENIEWVGKISFDQPLNKRQISKLMQKARALLVTTQKDEGFGLVAVEAQSCGTPVIAFDKKPMPEIIINGKTGFTVSYKKGLIGLKDALNKLNEINLIDCRKNAENNFSLESMTKNYEKLYNKLVFKK